MVDALDAAIRHLRPGGVLIDSRPDGDRPARVLARGRVVGRLVENAESRDTDLGADAAVARLLGSGRLRRTGGGHLWHTFSFADRAALQAFLDASPRYSGGVLGPRIPARGRLVVRRAVKWAVLARA